MIYKTPYAEVFEEITLKCWQDPDFKKRFLADPESVIKEHGIKPRYDHKIKVVEDTEPNLITIHLPPRPKGELSDEDLESVSGGKVPGKGANK